MTNTHKEEQYKSKTYDVGRILVTGVTRYTNKANNNKTDKTEIFVPSDNRKVEPLPDMYDQVIIRMSGRAAQELSQLELSTERFYNDLKSAIPYMKNIASIEGEYFPEIMPEEYKSLPEENYSIYIQSAKYMITQTAKLNNITPELLIKTLATRLILLEDNQYN
ncbi:MAG: hypothetical protein ACP5N1_03600 [Candidatus Woesearchaeota archaeon]